MKEDPEKYLQDLIDGMEEHPFGVITQEGYRELSAKIESHTGRLERRFRRWLIMGLTAFACIALTSSAALVGFGFLLAEQSQITRSIQDQRKDTIRTSCTDQNLRHDGTISALDMAKKDEIRRHPQRAGEIRRQTKVSKGLIDALAPHQDCDSLVKRYTSKESP